MRFRSSVLSQYHHPDPGCAKRRGQKQNKMTSEKPESSVAQREKLMACTSQNLGLLGKTKRY